MVSAGAVSASDIALDVNGSVTFSGADVGVRIQLMNRAAKQINAIVSSMVISFRCGDEAQGRSTMLIFVN